MSAPQIVIVDPYSSGRDLIRYLQNHPTFSTRFQLTTVQSSLALDQTWLAQMHDHVKNGVFARHFVLGQETAVRKSDVSGFPSTSSMSTLASMSGNSRRGLSDLAFGPTEESEESRSNSLEASSESRSTSLEVPSVEISEAKMLSTVASLAAAIADFAPIVAVLPGSEPGVLLCEQLTAALTPFASFLYQPNLPGSLLARRNKFEQQELLRERGVRAIRQMSAISPDQVQRWMTEQDGLSFPIIVKPSESGGSDGVHWCQCFEDVENAFALEGFGKVNVNGVANEALLAQEFLDGTEYVVDTASYNGKHVCVQIWQYKKAYCSKTGSISYESSTMLSREGELQEKLVCYIYDCLNALDVKTGVAHCEVIVNKTTGDACLVELGVRLHGGMGTWMSGELLGQDKGLCAVCADVYLNKGEGPFAELFEREQESGLKSGYKQEKVGMSKHLNTRRAIVEGDTKDTSLGRLTRNLEETDGAQEMLQLKTVKKAIWKVKKGDKLAKTRDLATAPGVLCLVGDNMDDVRRDAAKIEDIESSSDIYRCVEEGAP